MTHGTVARRGEKVNNSFANGLFVIDTRVISHCENLQIDVHFNLATEYWFLLFALAANSQSATTKQKFRKTSSRSGRSGVHRKINLSEMKIKNFEFVTNFLFIFDKIAFWYTW